MIRPGGLARAGADPDDEDHDCQDKDKEDRPHILSPGC